MTTKVLIAIVTNRMIKPKTVESLTRLIAYTDIEVVPVVAVEGYTTAENRNYCVIQALKNQCTHILFIDDDMLFPEDTLNVLMSRGKEIIGVNSQSRTLPLSTTVALLDKEGNHLPHDHIPPYFKIPEDVFECFSVGMGVALIDMSIFDVIDKPYFKFEVHESGKILIGEDAWLCKQARDKGYKIWCDPTLKIGHLGDYNYANYVN